MPFIESISARDDSQTLGPGIGRDLLLLVGPVYVGSLLNYCLLGTLIVQIYNYYVSFKRDSKWLKALVYTVFTFDLLQTVLTTHYSFRALVRYYGVAAVFKSPALTVIGAPLFGGLVGGCVQLFYAWRIWILAKWPYRNPWLKIFTGVVVCTSVVSTICAVTATFIFTKIDSHNGLYATDLSKLFATWFISSFVVDTLIAVAMVLIISNAKTNGTFRKTNDILTKILIRIVATGVLNAFVNGFEVALLYAVPPSNLGEVGPYIGGKLYSNTLLATLNARRRDSAAYGPTSPSELSSTRSTNAAPGEVPSSSMKFAPNLRARMDTIPGMSTTFSNGTSENETGGSDASLSRDDVNMQETKPRETKREHGTGDFLEIV